MSMRKLQTLSLKRKVELIQAVENAPPSKKKKEIAEEFGVLPNTLSTILKDKVRYEQQFYMSTTVNCDKQRQRASEKKDIDVALLAWFKGIREKNIPLSGTILLSKAEELAAGLGYEDWKCSVGWLDRFKKRHNIAFHSICGEAGDVPIKDCDEWTITKLPLLLKDYAAKDIFNADETGLFWRLLPNKTLCMKGETCTGGKLSKERVTVLVAANMDGSEKLPLLVIGKYENPRCFKNVKTLPVSYVANKKAWMTAALFEDWIKQLDRKMVLQNRKILLFVDNCPAHPHIVGLKAVKLQFLPPNTTARLQPCDQGIIWQLKCYYRKKLMQQIINHVDTEADSSHLKISLLDALHILRQSWIEVKSSGINNCFVKAGFKHNDEEDISVSEDTDASMQVRNIFEILRKEFSSIPANLSPMDYVDADNLLHTADLPNNEAIFQSMQSKTDQDESVDEDLDDQGEAISKVSSKEAYSALLTLQHYFSQNVTNPDVFNKVANLQETVTTIVHQKLTQTKITHFFV